MQSISSETGEQLLKRALIRKRTQCQENAIESKPSKDSKKASMSSAHKGKELLKVVRTGTEKLNLKETKCKSSTHSKLCFCSPTTHEGSFRCRLHRNIAAKKTSTAEKSNLRCSTSKRTHGIVEFKPQMSRFGRIASAEMGPHHDSLIQLSGVESV